MSVQVPAELKFIQNYLKRAAEIKDRDPVVAYYYMEKINSNPELKSYLLCLMDELEKEKKLLENDDRFKNGDLVVYAYLEEFAQKIFNQADGEDRKGNSTMSTARIFIAAANYLEILNVIKPIDEEIAGKIKYAKFRSTTILKALKDGTTPPPPASEQLSSPILSPTAELNVPPKVSQVPIPVVQQKFSAVSINDDFNEPLPADYYTFVESVVDPTISNEAQKFARFAISSLMFDDIPSAIQNLESALAVLKRK